MNLTLMNGIPLKVDQKKIETIGPHINGGSSIKVNGNTYHVEQTVEEILKQSDRQNP